MSTITINRAVVEQALEALEYGQHSLKQVSEYQWESRGQLAMDALRAALAQQAEPVLQTCNCRWDGDVQVQQCTLHEAHVDAIHEWAERAKVAERKLAQQAEPTPPDATAGLVDDLCLLHMGWKADAEGDLYRAAWGRVIARAKQLKAQVGKGEEK